MAAPEPKPGVVGVAGPLAVAPAVVTAQSSQVFSRNYNTLAAPLIAASPFRAAPIVAAAPALAAPAIAPAYAYSAPAIAAPYYAAPTYIL